jgi:hypothetical protein
VGLRRALLRPAPTKKRRVILERAFLRDEGSQPLRLDPQLTVFAEVAISRNTFLPASNLLT